MNIHNIKIAKPLTVLQKERIMKIILLMIWALFSITSFAQGWKNVRGKPKDLKESFEYLDKMLDDTTKYTYMSLPFGESGPY